MAWKLVIVTQIFFQSVFADYNFTYSMAHRCKEHLSTNGYHYGPFYRVTAQPDPELGAMFEMHIAILAASNGHILLSPIENPGPSDPVYEIVLGGGANKFSELRRMQRRLTKASERTVGILSPIHLRAFWIRITDDGSVDVGREGEVIPFLHWEDSEPLSVNYFSFASWTNVEAKFLYECPVAGDDAAENGSVDVGREGEVIPFLHWEDSEPLSVNYFSFASWTNVEAKFLYECPVAGDDAAENVTTSEVVMPTLTTAQQLKVDLLGSRSPLTPPSPRVTVKIGLTIVSLHYDAVSAVLETLVEVVLSWKDEQIVWNPDKYNSTTQLIFRQGEIWKPEFYVMNSVGIGALESKTFEPIYFLSSGVAVLHIRAKVSSWCGDRSNAMSAWPRDEYTCELYIGAWEMHEQIHIEMLETNEEEALDDSEEKAFIVNEWDLTHAGYRLSPTTHSPYTNVTCTGDEYPTQNSELVLRLNFHRKGAFNVVLYTPLLTAVVFLLMSFWTEPLAPTRISFYSGLAVLLCALLSYIDTMVPSHTLPSIVILYEVVLMTTLLAMLVQLVMMQPALEKSCTTGCLHSLLSNRLLRLICCLPPVKTYTSFGSEPEDTEALEPTGCASTSGVEQMQTELPPAPPGPRFELAGALDRAMFAAYAVLYAVLLACHY